MPHQPRSSNTFEFSRSVYLRNLLEPYNMYAVMGLQQHHRCFYIAESKAIAGKDTGTQQTLI
eukprot:4883598-Heterocapsa_arctica.AAC.1